MSKCKCDSDNDDSKFSPKEMFGIALRSRDFEIKMFWQRCNYFLILNTSIGIAVGAAVLRNGTPKYTLLLLLLCAIGVFVCFAWIKVGLGAKFWQSYWEQVVSDLQESTGLSKQNPCGRMDVFSDYDNILWRVEKGLKKEKNTAFGWLIKISPFWCSKQHILDKPSVSGWMHRTACFFFLVWFLAFLYTFFCIWLRVSFCCVFN